MFVAFLNSKKKIIINHSEKVIFGAKIMLNMKVMEINKERNKALSLE